MKLSSRATLTGVALLASLSANGALLEQKGTAEAKPQVMTTYGMDVSSRAGLKTVLPPGWQLFIHPSVKLPETMSWKVGDPWPSVMARFAQSSDVTVLLDWDSRQVLMRTEQVAFEERATRSQIQAAATTPLPRFGTRPAAAPALQVAAPAPTSSLDTVPVIRLNPTPTMVEEQQQAALRNPPQFMSNSDFAYTEAKAWNRASAKSLAQSIASRYRLRLVWSAPDYQLQGPVTLLAQSPEEDTLLLQKAMGVYSPIVVEHSRAAMQLRAYPRSAPRDPLLDAPFTAAAAAPASTSRAVMDSVSNWVKNIWPPKGASTVSSPSGVVLPPERRDEVPPPPAPAIAAPATSVVLALAPKQPLEDSLFKLSREMGYTLEWKVEGGFEANRPLSYTAADLPTLLSDVLPQLGLSADIYSRERHIVVRGAASRGAK